MKYTPAKESDSFPRETTMGKMNIGFDDFCSMLKQDWAI